jgi:hypothetical protein
MLRTISAAAALFVLAAPAFAAEKTDPRCSQYGEGFMYSADTGMCIKVSGELRTDYGFGKQYGIKRQTGFGSGASVNGQIDARGDSDFGPFRAVIEPTARKY